MFRYYNSKIIMVMWNWIIPIAIQTTKGQKEQKISGNILWFRSMFCFCWYLPVRVGTGASFLRAEGLLDKICVVQTKSIFCLLSSLLSRIVNIFLQMKELFRRKMTISHDKHFLCESFLKFSIYNSSENGCRDLWR